MTGEHAKAEPLVDQLLSVLTAHLDRGGSFPDIAGAVTVACAVVLGLASPEERKAVVETIVEELPARATKMAVLIASVQFDLAHGDPGGRA